MKAEEGGWEEKRRGGRGKKKRVRREEGKEKAITCPLSGIL
jgi:hypothetical protein